MGTEKYSHWEAEAVCCKLEMGLCALKLRLVDKGTPLNSGDNLPFYLCWLSRGFLLPNRAAPPEHALIRGWTVGKRISVGTVSQQVWSRPFLVMTILSLVLVEHSISRPPGSVAMSVCVSTGAKGQVL